MPLNETFAKQRHFTKFKRKKKHRHLRTQKTKKNQKAFNIIQPSKSMFSIALYQQNSERRWLVTIQPQPMTKPMRPSVSPSSRWIQKPCQMPLAMLLLSGSPPWNPLSSLNRITGQLARVPHLIVNQTMLLLCSTFHGSDCIQPHPPRSYASLFPCCPLLFSRGFLTNFMLPVYCLPLQEWECKCHEGKDFCFV